MDLYTLMSYMMDAYGKCQRCGEEGALWRHETFKKRWIFFGKKVPVIRYYCDECGE